MKTKVHIQVEKGKGDKNFACYMIEDNWRMGLAGSGTSARRCIENLQEVYRDEQEHEKMLPEDLEFEYIFDIGSFFSYYDYLNISAVAKRIGVNAALMRQYASGCTRPGKERYQAIMEGLREIAAEINAASISDYRFSEKLYAS